MWELVQLGWAQDEDRRPTMTQVFLALRHQDGSIHSVISGIAHDAITVGCDAPSRANGYAQKLDDSPEAMQVGSRPTVPQAEPENTVLPVAVQPAESQSEPGGPSEACVECLMRDQEVADVDVRSPDAWDTSDLPSAPIGHTDKLTEGNVRAWRRQGNDAVHSWLRQPLWSSISRDSHPSPLEESRSGSWDHVAPLDAEHKINRNYQAGAAPAQSTIPSSDGVSGHAHWQPAPEPTNLANIGESEHVPMSSTLAKSIAASGRDAANSPVNKSPYSTELNDDEFEDLGGLALF
jgi:hypothetical protein